MTSRRVAGLFVSGLIDDASYILYSLPSVLRRSNAVVPSRRHIGVDQNASSFASCLKRDRLRLGVPGLCCGEPGKGVGSRFKRRVRMKHGRSPQSREVHTIGKQTKFLLRDLEG